MIEDKELATKNIERIDVPRGYRCLACGTCWREERYPSGRRRAHWWHCPNGCNFNFEAEHQAWREEMRRLLEL